MFYTKPEKFNEIPIDTHCVIEASAGTGKTFMIKKIYFDLIWRGIKPEEILVATFTRDATAELRQRLKSELDEAIRQYDEFMKKYPNGLEETENRDDCWEINRAVIQRINHARQNFHRTVICTLDSLTQRLIHENRGLTKTAADAEVAKNISTHKAFGLFMREIVPHDDLLMALPMAYDRFETIGVEPLTISDEYKTEATSLKSDLDRLVLNGKFQQVSSPFEGRHFKGRWPENLTSDKDFFSYYQKIWADTAAHIRQMSGDIAKDLVMLLYQIMGLSLNRGKPYADDIKDIQKLIMYSHHDDKGCQWLNAAALFCQSGSKANEQKTNIWQSEFGKKDIDNETKIRNLQAIVEDNTADDFVRNLARLVYYCFPRDYFLAAYAAPKYAHCIEIQKSRQGRYLYDDFTRQLRESLYEPENAIDNDIELGMRQALRKSIQSRWKYVIIDEFQDTSEAQWAILKICFLHSGCHLYLIGDPKQAIYGFRGCDIFIYRSAIKDIKNITGKDPVQLDTNHRSTQAMVEAINDLYEPQNQLFVTPDIAAHSSNSAYIQDKVNSYQKVKAGESYTFIDDKGRVLDPIVYIECDDKPLDENIKLAQAIVDEIHFCLNENHCRIKTKDGKCDPKTIYVLARRNKDFKALRTALAKSDLAWSDTRENKNAFQLMENLDLLRIMRAIEHPNDHRYLADALNTVFFGLTLYQVDRLLSDENSKAKSCFKRWAGMARDNSHFSELFDDILKTARLEKRLHIFASSRIPYDNIREMMDALTEKAVYDDLSWSELIRWYIEMAQDETMASEKTDRSDQAQVQLMTVHGCKGLQADAVFLLYSKKKNDEKSNHFERKYHEYDGESWRTCYCTSKSDPHQPEASFESELEEERLLYVAITRAKCRLYLPKYPIGNNRNSHQAKIDVRESLQNAIQNHIDKYPSISPSQNSAELSQTDEKALGQIIQNALDAAPNAALFSYAKMDEAKAQRLTRYNHSYSELARDKHTIKDIYEVPQAVHYQKLYPELPGGTNTGLFLHEILEKIDFSIVKSLKGQGLNGDNWLDNVQEKRVKYTRDLFIRMQNKYKMNTAAVQSAQKLIFNVLTSDGHPFMPDDKSLCDADVHLSELDFLCSNEGMNGIGDASCHAHDMFNGSIDCCFRIQGTWYIIDWKSDSIMDTSPESLRAHVEARYAIQNEIYTAAFTRWLAGMAKPDKFGGMIYVFLRAVKAHGDSGFVWMT